MKKRGVALLLSAVFAVAAVGTAAVKPVQAQETARKMSFDEAIEDLYDRAGAVSDDEILSSARQMESDFDALKEAYGETRAQKIADAVERYEAEKSAYMLHPQEKAAVKNDILKEWEKQRTYTLSMAGGSTKLTDVIPRVSVCAEPSSGDADVLEVSEWMTFAYMDADKDVTCASAYRYEFTLTVSEQDGTFAITAVGDTDRNFAWEDTATADSKTEYKNLMAVQQTTRSAQEDADDAPEQTASSYRYSAWSACAYANTWALSRNRSKYSSFSNADCANFVSQCLRYGGMPTDGEWFKNSYTWVNVDGNRRHFSKYGTFVYRPNNPYVRPGNPVYYDWNYDGVYDHMSICVGYNRAGKPVVNAHTTDCYHVVWTLNRNARFATILLNSAGSTSSSGKSSTSGTSTSRTYRTGLVSTAYGKRYIRSNGTYARNSLIRTGGNYYYFNAYGYAVTGWWTIGGHRYYFRYDGQRGAAWKGWLRYGGKWYYFYTIAGYMARNTWVDGYRHYVNAQGVRVR